MKNRLVVLALASCWVSLLTCLPGNAESPATCLGKKIADFSLKDTQGHTVSLADFQNKKAIVVFFLGTECPINNAFLPYLATLHERYAPQGVQFLGINANPQDDPARVAKHAQHYAIPFPILKDPVQAVADRFGAQRTPETFLLDTGCVVRYCGRIDDQFGIGYQRPNKPTRNDLTEALDEVLAGKTVSVSSTPVAGCIITRLAKPKAEGSVTYSKEVARIVQKHCQECHRPGQVAPMALMTYDDAVAWSETMREVLQDSRMPPWYADPHYGKFSNDRTLADADRKTLLSWIEEGCPKGDDKDLPPAREFVEGWVIGKPELVLSMEEEFSVPAVGPKTGVPYQNFTVKTHFTEDRWISRAEAKPGNLAVVHHIVIFIIEPGRKFIPKAGNAPVLCGTAPGDMPVILPPGMAKKVPAGSELVFQMHYTPNGMAQKDRSSVGLIFAKEPPKFEVGVRPIANPVMLRIPPGDDNFQMESQYVLPRDSLILSFMPHMHLRGKDFLYEVIYPDGKKETLLSVPRYNFNWQSVYRFEKPIEVPKGTKVHCIAHFDNSAKNPSNPDPTQLVKWGDQTWEEMMIGWMDFAYELPGKQ